MQLGLVLYMRQEGRGIGLINKVKAYSLQDRGLDTVEANLALGFRDDERDYAVAAHMLASLNVGSIRWCGCAKRPIVVMRFSFRS